MKRIKINWISIWRVATGLGALALFYLGCMIAWESYKEHKRDRICYHHEYKSQYSNAYVKESDNGKIRLKSTRSGEYLTPKMDVLFDYNVRDSLAVFIRNGKRGFVNVYTGEVAIPAQYERAWMFSEGVGAVVKDGMLCFINSGNQKALPVTVKYWGLNDSSGGILFTGGCCPMYNDKGKCGLINKKGQWVLAPKYDWITSLIHHCRIVKLGDKEGVIDSMRHWVLPLACDRIVKRENGWLVNRDGTQQLLAFDGKTVIQPFVYDEVYYLTYGNKVDQDGDIANEKSDYLSYRIGDKWGIMDPSGRPVTPAIYTKVDAVTNDMFTCNLTDDNAVLVKGN